MTLKEFNGILEFLMNPSSAGPSSKVTLSPLEGSSYFRSRSPDPSGPAPVRVFLPGWAHGIGQDRSQQNSRTHVFVTVLHTGIFASSPHRL